MKSNNTETEYVIFIYRAKYSKRSWKEQTLHSASYLFVKIPLKFHLVYSEKSRCVFVVLSQGRQGFANRKKLFPCYSVYCVGVQWKQLLSDQLTRLEFTLDLQTFHDMSSLGNHEETRHSHILMPVLLSACAIPISMLFWIINVVYSILWPDTRKFTEGFVYSMMKRYSSNYRLENTHIYNCILNLCSINYVSICFRTIFLI